MPVGRIRRGPTDPSIDRAVAAAAPRRRRELVICPNCAPHSGHAPGKCRECRNCKCESRKGRAQFIIRGLHGSYFTQMTGIGPAFGGTRQTARRLETQTEVSSLMATWSPLASVGCKVESVPLVKGIR